MTALDLLLQLTAAGCSLSREEGERLRVQDPQHALTEALRQAIREYKHELLAMLMPERRIPLPRSPAPCWRCKGPSERQGLRYLLCPGCEAEAGAHDSLTQ